MVEVEGSEMTTGEDEGGAKDGCPLARYLVGL